MTTTIETAASWLRKISDGALAMAPLLGLTGPGGLIYLGAAEALGLAADLCDLGMHPVTAIQRIRSAAPDFDAVANALDAEARGK